MNIKEYIKKNHDIDYNLEKRDKIRNFTHQTLFGEDFSADKLEFGDIKMSQTVNNIEFFLDKLYFQDNAYYVYWNSYINNYVIESKDNNTIPPEVNQMVANIGPIRLAQLADLQKQSYNEFKNNTKGE